MAQYISSTSPDSKCINQIKWLVRTCCKFSGCIDVLRRKGDLYFVIEVGLVLGKGARIVSSHCLDNERRAGGNQIVMLGRQREQ